MTNLPAPVLHTAAALAALTTAASLAGCTEVAAAPRFELRWCSNGEPKCVLTQSEGSYVRGGFFASLERCNDAIRHLSFYGNKVGGTCVEIADWERKKLDRSD